ncbi:PREDICTED: alkaline/neutral invertase CINV2-like [Erythranthe guttata]|nr:PREDICTED: alkaline/neutral invertase CINV2-like [Erythranthe guttata]|eukprot:XP_012835525.1 PREDICTED: alkaline/neutral invertase CINV2-like [Erythranthe guttata]
MDGVNVVLDGKKKETDVAKDILGLTNVSSINDYDLSKLIGKPRLNIERKISFDDRSLSELSIGLIRGLDTYESIYSPLDSPTRSSAADDSFEPHPIVADAWEALRRSLVYFRGQPVGTIAAYDHASEEVLNYDQVFVRDFVPSALAFLMNGEPDIVKNFLLKTLQLQGCALVMMKQDEEGQEFIERIEKRLHALSYHMRSYFWIDFQQLNDINRYKTEEYSHTAVNKFNVIPDSIPEWVFDFMPTRGGYFVGNVSPARMDFRWFALGNCVAILSSLASHEQACAIMDLIEGRWEELVGEMPMKICYPAIENHEWRIVTGCDPKNTRWSYHNGGSWPVLLWMVTAASIKTGRPQIARRAIDIAESRLGKDGWPEYYDGKLGRYIGKQARKNQTWSIAGYLVAKMMLEDPSNLGMISLEQDKQMKHVFKRCSSWTC